MNWGRLYFGLIVVTIGVVLLLGNAGVLDAGDFIGTWWPVLLIMAGVLTVVANPGHWSVAFVLAAVGVGLLLSNLDLVDLGRVFIPAIIILVGVIILFGRGLGSTTESGDHLNSFNLFSGSQIASHSKDFHGGSVSAVFGGAEIDLRHAVPSHDAKLDIFAALGAVEIRVPEGWEVAVHALPIFGGVENVTSKEPVPAGAPKLSISATIVFGGLEIKH